VLCIRAKTLYNSPDVQARRYCPSLRVIIRPRRLCSDSAANGPRLQQGVSAEDSAKAESLGADALQLGTISAFNWIACIQTEAARLDYYIAFFGYAIFRNRPLCFTLVLTNEDE
jgi:hypothetical protein